MLLSGTFVQLTSVTVLQVAIPDVQRDLHAGPAAAQLVLAGYTLTYACTLITSARVGDRWGPRRTFAAGMAVFTLATVVAGAAPGVGVLVAGRLAQGLGSGLMAPQVLTLIQRVVPAERRPRALGAYGATMALASIAGPLLAGALLQLDPFGLGWRAAVLVTVPVGLVLLLVPALPPDEPGRDARVDPAGAVLSLAGVALLVLPLTVGREAGRPAWSVASLVAAVMLLGAFAAVQRRVAHPLVPPQVLADAGTRWGIGLVFLFNTGVPSFTLLLSLHSQQAQGVGPLATAFTVAPYAIGALVGSSVSEHLGRSVLTGSASALVGASLLVAVTIGMPEPRWALWLVLAGGGFGFGAFTAAVFTRVLARAEPSAASALSGLLPTAQQLGGTFSVALAGSVYYGATGGPGTALWHAMVYEAVVFALAAGAASVLARRRPG
ncbi:MFS transporter [Actinokineospora bangkokensis]|uniref:MFS transporter n=1 Tax=Actinokineospora bangkokensis TaxID=1193682 RepID=A0A1Q9LM30_9PSEU|nr:MFS transporter [Actinokineospora bangkokensis]